MRTNAIVAPLNPGNGVLPLHTSSPSLARCAGVPLASSLQGREQLVRSAPSASRTRSSSLRKMKPLILLSAAALAVTTSSVARSDDDPVKTDPPPPATYATMPSQERAPSAVAPASVTTTSAALETEPRYKSERPNKPLLFTGGVAFLAAYAPTVILTTATSNSKTNQVLYIPLVGPWVRLASPTSTTSVTTVDTMLIIGSGVVQGIGAVLMATSLFIPGRVALPTLQAGDTKIYFGPTSFGVGSAGAGALGSF
jgi:hypothetical protein